MHIHVDGYHHVAGGDGQSPLISELKDSHVGHVLPIAPRSTYIMNTNLKPYSHSSGQSFSED